MATTNTKPSIEVEFKKLASTAIVRGTKGRVGLVIFDDTDKTFSTLKYKLIADLEKDSAKYTDANLEFLKDCFLGNPSSVTVVRIDVAGAIADALNIVKNLKLDWIGTVSGTQADQEAVAQFVKAQEILKKTYKAVVFNPSTEIDCKHVVVIANSKVTFSNERGEKDSNEYIPSMLGILAGLALDRSATYLKISNLKYVTVTDEDASIKAGKLVLFNDEDSVKISTAVNSLTTIDEDNVIEMSKIEIVEMMDLIMNDITSMFKNNYVGKYKNTVDRQKIFIGNVITYLYELAKDDLLDSEYNNVVAIDVNSQREAWKSEKGDEVDEWTDAQVENTAFHNKVFLMGDIKIVESVENLKFEISLF